jgi:hypothetical protein
MLRSPWLLLGVLFAACAEGGARPTGGAGDSGGASGAGAEGRGDLDLPFAVDDHFSSTGMMGDAVESLAVDPNGCKPRPEGAQGRCHAFLLSPGGSVGWSGLYWLATPHSWGESPGVSVAPGAKRLRFRAAASPSVSVKFLVGGITGSAPYPDEFQTEATFYLEGTLKEFEIPLLGTTYESGVQGGFGWSLGVAEPVTLWLDDIRWE